MSRGDQYLDEIAYASHEQEEIPERTRIIVELAVRLRDLHDFDSRLTRKLLHRLNRIYQNHPESFRECLDVLAGNVKGDKSLAVIQAEKPEGIQFSKQNIHQTEQRRLGELERDLPEIAKALAEIRGRTYGSEGENASGGKS